VVRPDVEPPVNHLTSEREVEYFFAIPLLQELGFFPEQFVVGFRVKMYEGVRKVEKEADMVVFADDTKRDALIVVETKRAGRPLTEDVAGQAKAYSLWLRAPYCLLTNGDDVRVFHFRGPWHADVLLLAFSRAELQEKWTELYRCLNPETVIEFKERLREQMQVSAVA
jgi:type I site-specific restriction endonuclease